MANDSFDQQSVIEMIKTKLGPQSMVALGCLVTALIGEEQADAALLHRVRDGYLAGSLPGLKEALGLITGFETDPALPIFHMHFAPWLRDALVFDIAFDSGESELVAAAGKLKEYFQRERPILTLVKK